MPESSRQGDLFGGGWSAATAPPVAAGAPAPRALDDAALLAAMQQAGQANCAALAAEILERRLDAVPELEALCRRLKGFGLTHPVREQVVALETLAALGGAQAVNAVERLIAERIVEGPGLRNALAAAAALKARLPAEAVMAALNSEDPALRAAACRSARFCRLAQPRLIELLEDLHAEVAGNAAITLGEMGHQAAKPRLMHMIEAAPSAEIIGALVAIEDEECLVKLGRLAARRPDLHRDICDALGDSEHPVAARILRRLGNAIG